MKTSLKIFLTIFLYIVFFCVIYFLYKYNKIKDYSLYIVIFWLILLIKDLLLYFVDFDKKYFHKFDLSRLFKDLSRSRVSYFHFTLIFNRNLFFPFILIFYMIYLFIWQTHLWGLDKKSLFLAINQNYLLWITTVSWIFTVFKENIDNKYFYEKLEWWIFSKNILLTIWLSIFWTYIIFNQVVKLGFLSYPISIISGILIFLVWISILEDDENLESNN
jgi:hypothetical protein